jgi:hypothetical protein
MKPSLPHIGHESRPLKSVSFVVGAAVVLAPVGLAVAVDRELAAVRRVGRPHAHVGADVLRHPAVEADRVELSGPVFGAVRGEEDPLRVRRPAEHRIVRRMRRQLPGRAAGGRDDVNVQVAVAIAGKRDPLPVGREARIDVARAVDGDAADVPAAVVRRPDVPEVGERDLTRMVMRVANELRFRASVNRHEQREQSS